MLTFEQVLDVFSAYLAEDDDYEVIQTRHGCTVLCWDKHTRNWESSEYCETPEALAKMLASNYATFLIIRAGGCSRDLSEDEKAKIEVEHRKMLIRCGIE